MGKRKRKVLEEGDEGGDSGDDIVETREERKRKRKKSTEEDSSATNKSKKKKKKESSKAKKKSSSEAKTKKNKKSAKKKEKEKSKKKGKKEKKNEEAAKNKKTKKTLNIGPSRRKSKYQAKKPEERLKRGRKKCKTSRLAFTEFEGRVNIHYHEARKFFLVVFDLSKRRGLRVERNAVTLRSYADAVEVAVNYSKFKLHGVREAKPSGTMLQDWIALGKPPYEGFFVSKYKICHLGYYSTVMQAAVAHDFAMLRLRSLGAAAINFFQLRQVCIEELKDEEAAIKILFRTMKVNSRAIRAVEAKTKKALKDAPTPFAPSSTEPARPVDPLTGETLTNSERSENSDILLEKIDDIVQMGSILLEQKRFTEAAKVGSTLLDLFGKMGVAAYLSGLETMVRCIVFGLVLRRELRTCSDFLKALLSPLRRFHGRSVKGDPNLRIEFGTHFDRYYTVLDRHFSVLHKSHIYSKASTSRGWRRLRCFVAILLIRVLVHQNRIDEALHALQELLRYKTFQTSPEINIARGCLLATLATQGDGEHRKLDLFKEAEECFKVAHGLDPDNTFIINLLTDVQLQVILRVGVSQDQRLSQTQSQRFGSQKRYGDTDPWNESDDSDNEEFADLWGDGTENAVIDSQQTNKAAYLTKLEKFKDQSTFSIVRDFCHSHPASDVGHFQMSRLFQIQLEMTDEFEDDLFENTQADLNNTRKNHALCDPLDQSLTDQFIASAPPFDILDVLFSNVEHLTYNQCPDLEQLLYECAPWSSAQDLENFLNDLQNNNNNNNNNKTAIEKESENEGSASDGADASSAPSFELPNSDNHAQKQSQEKQMEDDSDSDLSDFVSAKSLHERQTASEVGTVRSADQQHSVEDMIEVFNRVRYPTYSVAQEMWMKLDRLPREELLQQRSERLWWKERFFLSSRPLSRAERDGVFLAKDHAPLLYHMVSVGEKLNLLDMESK